MWLQRTIKIPAKSRGFHLVTSEIIAQSREIDRLSCGLLHLFLQHTSASLTLNENADITVREDFERYFNHSVKDDTGYFRHTMEGPDDMPAHIKSSLLGVNLTIPINNGRLKLGTWQGIYLGEHRNHAGSRSIVMTLQGETT